MIRSDRSPRAHVQRLRPIEFEPLVALKRASHASPERGLHKKSARSPTEAPKEGRLVPRSRRANSRLVAARTAGRAGARERPSAQEPAPYVVKLDDSGWSLYGAPWLQPVAIIGKSDRRASCNNKPKPLPRAAISCENERMVRRGSTVRVRQRALQKASKWPLPLPGRRTLVVRSRENLSPRPVPSINAATDSRLEQTAPDHKVVG